MKKLKCLLSVAMLIMIYHTTWAKGGDLVNNGGGLAEKNVIYAYEKLGSYLKLCLDSETCKLNSSQKILLQKILKGLAEEKASQQLSFVSEQKQPGFFLLDGNIRIAKTGSEIGSKIFVNIDMLYTKNKSGLYDACTIPEATAILVHELGHHYGDYTHDELDFLGVRVSLLLQSKMLSTPLVPWKSDISLDVFNRDEVGQFPEVLLYVGNDVIDLSSFYQNAVICEGFKVPIPVLPIPDIPLVTSAAKGSIFHNLHWEKIKDRDTRLDIQITGNVSNRCKSKSSTEIRNNSSQLTIKFKVNKMDQSWVYDASSLTMRQFEDPWWKIIKIPN